MNSLRNEYLSLIQDFIFLLKEENSNDLFDATLSQSCFSFPHKKDLLKLSKTSISLIKKKAPSFEKKKSQSRVKEPSFQKETTSVKESLLTDSSEKKESQTQENIFSLSSFPQPKQPFFDDLKKSLTKTAPHLMIYNTPPNDSKAKEVKNAWKIQMRVPQVPVFFSNGFSQHKKFLENIAKAIQLRFGESALFPIETLEKQDRFESLFASSKISLIITPDNLLFNCPNLLKHLRKYPNENKCFLGKIPTLLLPDLSLYYKDPLFKRSLWNAICQHLNHLL